LCALKILGFSFLRQDFITKGQGAAVRAISLTKKTDHSPSSQSLRHDEELRQRMIWDKTSI
jgi:hypothetical protein